MILHTLYKYRVRHLAAALFAVTAITALSAVSGLFATSAHAQTVESIKQKGVLLVGVQADQVPWGFVDDKNVNVGYDIDVAQLMAADMGVKLQLVPVTVPNRIANLLTGKADIMAGVMGMYPDRAKVIQFSKPYSVVEIMVYGKKTDTIKSMDDLTKFRVGVSRASAQDIAISKALPNLPIQRYDGDTVPVQALLSGQVDAIGGTNTYAPVIARSPAGAAFEQKFSISRQYNGLCVRLGQKDLNTWINAFIDRNMANGKLNAINKKWLGTDLPTMPTSLPGIPFTAS